MSGNPCPRCNSELPKRAVAGLCPACLLRQGVQESAPATSAFSAPTPTELAPAFPQFDIIALIGKGGMGAVYKARQTQLDRIVALKILPPGAHGAAAFAARFATEARALAKLNHPNIVTIHDFGQTTLPARGGRADGPLFYFVMEFVDGVNLRQLQLARRLAPREALALIPQICDALQYAHDHGIVHRDIKPDNILVDRQGRVKVADFGLAKLLGAVAAGNAPETDRPAQTPAVATTQAGQIMGTPHYMAPEQRERPAEVDHRADIYSLGVVFYQMLTGELPGQQIEPPSRRVKIDVRLDDVVLHALEQNPERRYQHVSEVKTAVEHIERPRRGWQSWQWAAVMLGGCGLVGALLLVAPWRLKPAAEVPPPYTFTIRNNTITLARYTGTGGAVVIPDKIRGLPVTAIGHYAFSKNSNVVSVAIPSSITKIDDMAFYASLCLTNVLIPASVTNIDASAFLCCPSLVAITVAPQSTHYSSVDGVLFDKSQHTLICYPGAKEGVYSIPKQVTKIGESAFETCTHLSAVTIPEGVAKIGADAFSSCSSLTNVSLPASVTNIGILAFCRCQLRAITVASNNPAYYSVDGVLFDKRTQTLVHYPVGRSASRYTVPDGVASIGPMAFWDCDRLEEVILPDSVTNIGIEAFAQCVMLTSVKRPHGTNLLATALIPPPETFLISIPATARSPKSFWCEYRFRSNPGKGHWSSQGDYWLELHGQGGVTNRYVVVDHILRDNTPGTLLVKIEGGAEPSHAGNKGDYQVFIPDIGSANMHVLHRRKNKGVWRAWMELSDMQDVQ